MIQVSPITNAVSQVFAENHNLPMRMDPRMYYDEFDCVRSLVEGGYATSGARDNWKDFLNGIKFVVGVASSLTGR